MIEYTIKDVIIDTEDSRVVGAIGKNVYYGNNPYELLYEINKGVSKIGILNGISESKICNSFKIKENKYFSYQCIIIKKEEPKKYIPFESAEEFIKAFDIHTHSDKDSEIKTILYLCGMWLKWNNDYIAVTHITDIGINDCDSFADWQDLCDNYTFLDETPCGKLSEGDK